ncbi:MAG TPA: TlpA disulfide reductase family protein [Candidatus Dormibacteraeota bacterium]|nr:TlpA disulfide reductase family protein [Candidatus Dormibacteraeota bacterium]
MTWRGRWLAPGLAVVVALAVAGGVLLASRGGGGGGASGVVSVSSGRPVLGSVPPAFQGTALDGSRFDLAAERGRVVVVNFFATWCDNCRAELPLLQRTYAQRHAAGLDVVTVDFNDTGDARGFLAPYGLGFPALLDAASRVGHAYLVSDLPVTFFIGRDGRLARVFHGQLSEASLSESLAGLV